jgi:hypothetical protein
MTPDFPSLAGGFAQQLHQLRTTTGSTLHQFEALFGGWIQRFRLAQQDEGPHSRDRRWNLRLLFWTFLWQVAQAGASCREAIRQAQSLCRLNQRAVPPDESSPYCQARSGLPTDRLEEIHQAVVAEAEAGVAVKDLWCGHRVQVADATTVTMPDTALNQEAYPQQKSQKPGCGFPLMRLMAFFNLATGLLVSWVTGPWLKSEVALLHSLWEHLRTGDVLVGDRGFCHWAVLAVCRLRGIHGVFRVRGSRRKDFRRGKRLSKHERLVCWRKPKNPSACMSAEQWAQLPDCLELRLVRCQLARAGYRTHQVILVTTLLDSVKYPVADLGMLYLRRWDMELTLRHLKTTLQMEHLSCKTPDNVERELRMHLLVHNLVRRLMLEASRRSRVPLDRVSFAGALALARRFGEALLQARSKRKRLELTEELYRVLADDLVPDRPGRREPRAIKRRPKPFPLLTKPRSVFRETPHKSHFWEARRSRAQRKN